ncbi:hypothetical protein WISP_85328 [Willisornis vidua]|uniref:Reverse transcriptase domain-containing protein n=1 Tax=Willisornis vidua TaxID=1566151 RepID=A0ABQ9D970_9PASS|nr:hypothetical protein WISP_85328 [Willisornis vidua]
MKNCPTICQTVVSRYLDPVRQKYPEDVIYHYMDDIFISAPDSTKLQLVHNSVIQQQEHLYYIQHIRSHTDLPGPLVEGNRVADAAANSDVMGPTLDGFHQDACDFITVTLLLDG